MLDFVKTHYATQKDGSIKVFADFMVDSRTTDLMIRGNSFYAIWDEEAGLWSTNPYDVQRLVDKELYSKADELKTTFGPDVKINIKTLTNFSTGAWSQWLKFSKSCPDNYHELDIQITFENDDVTKESYVSKRVPYAIHSGPTPAYDELMGVLYSPEERAKLEWAIGSIFVGDSKRIQKFIVLYGSAGTGKGTILSIIDQLFEGYCSAFEAKALTSTNNAFALEAFKNNPLVAIQYDGDLSRIADNTKLNSIVSHEPMVINEKFKGLYESRFHSFLFMGTNSPVMITDAKSGILRRLIDVRPTGNLIEEQRYDYLTRKIKFELGAIAQHCIDIYKRMGMNYYSKYRPREMMGATNEMYNFVEEKYEVFAKEDGISLRNAYLIYKAYCEDANVDKPLQRTKFGEELKSYFKKFYVQTRLPTGQHVRSYYSEFDTDQFDFTSDMSVGEPDILAVFRPPTWLMLDKTVSLFDDIYKDRPAQYSKDDGTPTDYWANVRTKLMDIDTSREHYVQTPQELICIDFDIRGEDGEKDRLKNLEAASHFPETYAEYSKSGKGVHLYYIYTGDPTKLCRTYDDNIEVKVFTGNSALRRKLCGCNDIPIATIGSGLPVKDPKGDKMLDCEGIQNEKQLRKLILNCLHKKHHGATKPEIDYIYSELEKAYNKGIYYDVTDMRPSIQAFATNSTHQPVECLRKVGLMHFKSDEDLPPVEYENTENNKYKDADTDLVIFDIEVFPNLLLICWKFMGEGKPVYSLFNPTPTEIEPLLKLKLIGFNNRSYDNHIVYAAYMGKSNYELYEMSQRIIGGSKNAKIGSAYNLSYTDIYDFSSKKQSLKKWEIELGIHHQELGLPWDEPVPEDKWNLVAEYCKNDVIATEAVWNARREDFAAREILARISGLTVNDTTRMHTTKIIFGENKKPELVYTDLREMFPGYEFNIGGIDRDRYISEPVSGKSIYKGEDPGEGGKVYAEPGQYYDVALLDIESMHPTSIRELNLFGVYTQKYVDILNARLAIKHRDYDKARNMLDGVLEPYLGSDEEAGALSAALKIVINSVYGYTTAKFDNPFKDPRNVDNIVAKRGALFMINLKNEVQARGYTVAHIKTDSIKIPNATPEIIQFVMDYGKQYGYRFEHEATYEKMCLVNDAVYIAKYKDGKHAGEWTATGKQFQVPYVFKTLFSHEPIIFEDKCETKSVTTAMYLDMNENLKEDEHNYVFIGRAGQFCPMLPGSGGGVLLREKEKGSYSAVTGTKGYRWLESEVVRNLGKEDLIDKSYYKKLVDDAVETISKYCDFETFVADSLETYVNAVPFMNAPKDIDDQDKEVEYGN